VDSQTTHAEGEGNRGCGGKGNACRSSLDKKGENAASDSCKKQNGASAASCAMMGKRGKEMGGQERGGGGKGIERNEALEKSAQLNSREHREERKRREMGGGGRGVASSLTLGRTSCMLKSKCYTTQRVYYISYYLSTPSSQGHARQGVCGTNQAQEQAIRLVGFTALDIYTYIVNSLSLFCCEFIQILNPLGGLYTNTPPTPADPRAGTNSNAPLQPGSHLGGSGEFSSSSRSASGRRSGGCSGLTIRATACLWRTLER